MAARFVDAIARFPGMDGEDSDATGAYTQTVLGEDCPETWISLPRDRHPKSWYRADGSCKYDNPVIRLVRNLYGHPLAGLYWQKFCMMPSLKSALSRLLAGSACTNTAPMA